MNSHRSWFPLILTGLSVALGALLLAAYDSNDAPAEAPAAVTAPTNEEYQAEIVALFGAEENVAAKRDRLTAMRVPTDFLALHLQLVFVFNDFVDGDAAAAEARLDALRAANAWLP